MRDGDRYLRVRITNHALERYRQRVLVGSTDIEAAHNLVDELRWRGRITRKRPAWLRPGSWHRNRKRTVAWAMLGGETALPLVDTRKGLCAPTCIVRDTWHADRR